MKILAIDPGTFESAYCMIDAETYKPLDFDKIGNRELLDKCSLLAGLIDTCVIEKVASFGMPVGAEVFDTCIWIGRFTQHLAGFAINVDYVFRQEEKLTLCHDQKANDTTIKQALVDRFAYGQKNHGKGTVKAPGWFYGFRKDVWSAYAVGVTYLDKQRGKD